MSNLIEDLLALQSLVRIGETATPQQKTRIEELRARIPAPVVAHFFRQIANGHRGIALVRNGVCGECHLRLSRAMVAMLGRSNELLVCESCGSFVALAPEEQAMMMPAPTPRVRRVSRTPVVVTR